MDNYLVSFLELALDEKRGANSRAFKGQVHLLSIQVRPHDYDVTIPKEHESKIYSLVARRVGTGRHKGQKPAPAPEAPPAPPSGMSVIEEQKEEGGGAVRAEA